MARLGLHLPVGRRGQPPQRHLPPPNHTQPEALGTELPPQPRLCTPLDLVLSPTPAPEVLTRLGSTGRPASRRLGRGRAMGLQGKLLQNSSPPG